MVRGSRGSRTRHNDITKVAYYHYIIDPDPPDGAAPSRRDYKTQLLAVSGGMWGLSPSFKQVLYDEAPFLQFGELPQCHAP